MGVVVLFVFMLLRFAPGDPAALIAGDYATPDDIAKIRVSPGAGQTRVRAARHLAEALAQADLGTSIYSKLPVTHLMAQRVVPTLSLAASTLLFAVLLAVPLGTLAAWKAGPWIDRAVMIVCRRRILTARVLAGLPVHLWVLHQAADPAGAGVRPPG